MKKISKIFAFAVAFLLFKEGFSQFSATAASNQLAKSLGIDISGYKIYADPCNNYGLGTSCIKKFSLSKGNVACDMIDCYSLANFPEDSEQWKSVNGMAYKGTTPGIYVDKNVSSSYGISVILPKILRFLGIDASLAGSSSLHVVITIDSVLKRSLNYDNYMQHVLASSQTGRLYKAYMNKHLVIAVADFVLMGYTVELTPADSIGFRISSKVDSVMKISSPLTLSNDSLSINFQKKRDGTIIVSSHKPVILGVSVVKQKNIQTEGELHSFSDDNGWEMVNPSSFDDPTIKRKEK